GRIRQHAHKSRRNIGVMGHDVLGGGPGEKESASRPVSRVLSPPLWRGTIICLGRRLPGASSGLTRDTRSEQLPDAETSGPCSALLRAGFTWPAGHPAAGGLLPHHFTVASVVSPGLCHFCGTLLRVTPTGRYPAPCSM